ncbi:glycosyltransferase family 4 protein [Prevotella sp. P6B1]|uniref:glycosyltransferase family 4 protein n=1 Tax=Prevotella sp. P6B1 TaxID=1410613 RepID=UPI00051C3180|nr:glycosyltransferase family 4 protein [Prevotella sp. P6B1]
MIEKKIKICALTTISKTMDWFVVDSMRNLSNNGYDVTLICNMEEGFAERNSDYAKCINIPMSRGASLHDIIKVPIQLYKLFRREKFDVIYYTSPNVSLYASVAGWLAGVKCRFYNQCGLRYVSFKGKKRSLFKFIEQLTCSFSTTIRGQSPLNRQFAIDEGLCPAEKISVVGIGGTTGVSLKECDSFNANEAKLRLRDKYGIPVKGFLFGYVGRVNADKGINELITAFLELQKKHDDIYLALVGMIDDTNPISEENMRIAKENSHICFTGNVPPNEVYAHMAMFDVLTHPTYREGFGKVLQEAMGVRLPIITTDVPGPSEVVENGVSGLLVKDHDSVDLCDKMELLYSDSSLRESLSLQGRMRAEKYFDRAIMLNNILKDLNSTLGV